MFRFNVPKKILLIAYGVYNNVMHYDAGILKISNTLKLDYKQSAKILNGLLTYIELEEKMQTKQNPIIYRISNLETGNVWYTQDYNEALKYSYMNDRFDVEEIGVNNTMQNGLHLVKRNPDYDVDYLENAFRQGDTVTVKNVLNTLKKEVRQKTSPHTVLQREMLEAISKINSLYSQAHGKPHANKEAYFDSAKYYFNGLRSFAKQAVQNPSYPSVYGAVRNSPKTTYVVGIRSKKAQSTDYDRFITVEANSQFDAIQYAKRYVRGGNINYNNFIYWIESKETKNSVRNSAELEIGGRDVVFTSPDEILIELPVDELEQLEELSDLDLIDRDKNVAFHENEENEIDISDEDYDDLDLDGYEHLEMDFTRSNPKFRHNNINVVGKYYAAKLKDDLQNTSVNLNKRLNYYAQKIASENGLPLWMARETIQENSDFLTKNPVRTSQNPREISYSQIKEQMQDIFSDIRDNGDVSRAKYEKLFKLGAKLGKDRLTLQGEINEAQRIFVERNKLRQNPNFTRGAAGNFSRDIKIGDYVIDKYDGKKKKIVGFNLERSLMFIGKNAEPVRVNEVTLIKRAKTRNPSKTVLQNPVTQIRQGLRQFCKQNGIKAFFTVNKNCHVILKQNGGQYKFLPGRDDTPTQFMTGIKSHLRANNPAKKKR